AVAALGGAVVICSLMIAGLPPLAGFIGKVGMIGPLIETGGLASWLIVAVLALSSLAAIISLTRLGVGAIWTRDETAPPFVVGAAELVGITSLLGACLVISLFADP